MGVADVRLEKTHRLAGNPHAVRTGVTQDLRVRKRYLRHTHMQVHTVSAPVCTSTKVYNTGVATRTSYEYTHIQVQVRCTMYKVHRTYTVIPCTGYVHILCTMYIVHTRYLYKVQVQYKYTQYTMYIIIYYINCACMVYYVRVGRNFEVYKVQKR